MKNYGVPFLACSVVTLGRQELEGTNISACIWEGLKGHGEFICPNQMQEKTEITSARARGRAAIHSLRAGLVTCRRSTVNEPKRWGEAAHRRHAENSKGASLLPG